jgi:hypothetical protein
VLLLPACLHDAALPCPMLLLLWLMPTLPGTGGTSAPRITCSLSCPVARPAFLPIPPYSTATSTRAPACLAPSTAARAPAGTLRPSATGTLRMQAAVAGALRLLVAPASSRMAMVQASTAVAAASRAPRWLSQSRTLARVCTLQTPTATRGECRPCCSSLLVCRQQSRADSCQQYVITQAASLRGCCSLSSQPLKALTHLAFSTLAGTHESCTRQQLAAVSRTLADSTSSAVRSCAGGAVVTCRT